ncbi:MAG: DNA polymerase I [Mollicutes bacterium]|nr:DNA polymerase I [Mollicutes bacterium]
MKNVILIDGNNLMFRSYYATSYSGIIMKNQSGFPTNALYGFVSMLNKIIEEENPSYMAVAFDIGKTFRHDKYEDYKAGRSETPEELKLQMPVARELLNAMGIKYYEIDNYEADDIIGALAKETIKDPNFVGTIISSDKDLLQLISPQIEMKLLKQKGNIRYDVESFTKDFGFPPINMIDFKALAGDPSDNIPGVKGIGEKTATKLISEYTTIENIYDNIDKITGSVKDKLLKDKDNAFLSKEIATIFQDIPYEFNLEETKFTNEYSHELKEMYERLEFKSFLKNLEKNKPQELMRVNIISDLSSINLTKPFAYYIEADQINYHYANILGMGIYDGENSYFIDKSIVKDLLNKYQDSEKYTFDLKKNICLLKMDIENNYYDLMIGNYLLGITKDDLGQIMNEEMVISYDQFKKNNFQNLETIVAYKAKYIYEQKEVVINKINSLNMSDLFNNIEMPLINVLAKMEIQGVKVNKNKLEDMRLSMQAKLDILENKIYDEAREIFNISSPKQLGEILFDKLKLPFGKKGKTGYSTDASVLNKLKDSHPIIPLILDYRNYKKIQSTYLEGLSNYIDENDKIHTIFKQGLTRTGRLSSTEPNLQNIPIRDEEGRKIRMAFIPEYDLILSADYSQIELRLLAHLAESKELIEAFKNDQDIHIEVASKLYNVSEEAVTKEMRSNAKAVVFGIVYGISDYGLSEGTNLSPKEAKRFIERYFEVYPSVKKYMDEIVEFANDFGYVTTMMNRRRVIDELKSSSYMVRQSGNRIALNTPIQGSSADIIKKAMVEIDQELRVKNFQSKMILTVHDELIFDVIESEKEELEKLVTEIMDNTVKLSVPLKVGINYGSNWYEA